MCKSRKYHEIYFYFIKLFVNLLSFRFHRIQPLHTSVAVAADDDRSSDTDCESSNSDSCDEGNNNNNNYGIYIAPYTLAALWRFTILLLKIL